MASGDEEDAVTLQHLDTFLSESFGDTLALLARIYGPESVDQCQKFVEQLRTDGTEHALAGRRSRLSEADLIRQWIETESWAASENFLREHRSELARNQIVQQFVSSRDTTRLRHAAILLLTQTMDIGDVYEIVTEPAQAAAIALTSVRTGDLAKVQLVAMACPHLMADEFYGTFIVGILAIAGDSEAPVDQLRAAAERNDQATLQTARDALTALATLDTDRLDQWSELLNALGGSRN